MRVPGRRRLSRRVIRAFDASSRARDEAAAEVAGSLREQIAALQGHLQSVAARVDSVNATSERLLDYKDALRELRAGVDAAAGASAQYNRRLEQLDARVGALGLRIERHLEPIEQEAAREISRTLPDYDAFFAVAQPAVASGRTLLSYGRLHVLWQALANSVSDGQAVVEVGAYKGGSAWFLASALRSRGVCAPLHVIDTFAGHPQSSLSDVDSLHHTTNSFADTSVEEVREFLADLPSVSVHQGDGVDVLPALELSGIGLVHLDMDLHRPTAALLRHLADRMAPGGVVVVDDYGAPKCPGIRQAIAEFTRERSDFRLWTLATDQAVLVQSALTTR